MNKIDLLYFVDFVCDVLTIDIDKILIKEDGKLYNLINKKDKSIEAQGAKARFMVDDNGNNILWLDLDRHNNYEELLSILHELRHAYQIALVYDNSYDITDDKELQTWMFEIENYIPFGNKGYYNQTIELDANAFTVYMAEYLFGVQVTHEYEQGTMREQIEIIAGDFQICEINECKKRSKFDFAKYSRLIKKTLFSIDQHSKS